jgi:uncharacterized membrane protein YphA (DoxX/SURF4 family)
MSNFTNDSLRATFFSAQGVARLIAAILMLQTLFFKFTAAPESVYIFSTIGAEPVGRIGAGISELIASVLLLIPRTGWAGALLGIGIMGGAILTHLIVLGIEVQGDGGQLFAYAVIILLCCLYVAWVNRAQIPFLDRYLPRVLGLVLMLTLNSCTIKSETPAPIGTATGAPVSVNNPTQTFDLTGQTLLVSGIFASNVHTTKGTAKVYEKAGKRTLVMEGFTTDGGPDLRIYLADGTTFTSFVEVGKLTATGNFFVEVPSTYDPAKHGFVLIWCKQFSVLFGNAPLKK